MRKSLYRLETAVPNISCVLAIRCGKINGWKRHNKYISYIELERMRKITICISFLYETISEWIYTCCDSIAIAAQILFIIHRFSQFSVVSLYTRRYRCAECWTWRQVILRAVVVVLNCHTLGRNVIDVAHAYRNVQRKCSAHLRQNEREEGDRKRDIKNIQRSRLIKSREKHRREGESESEG